MKKETKLSNRFGSAVTAGLISTALVAAPLTMIVAATPAIAETGTGATTEQKIEGEITDTAKQADAPVSATISLESGETTTKWFDTVQHAIDWAKTGKVSLLKDTTGDINVAKGTNIELNLNGKKLTGNINNSGTLTINDNNTELAKQGTLIGSITNDTSSNKNAKVTVSSGKFTSDIKDFVADDASVVGLKPQSSDVTTFTTGDDAIKALVATAKKGDTIVITKVGGDGTLSLSLSKGSGVTILNQSKGKVALSNVELDPGEYLKGSEKVQAVSMYRLYNPNSGEHFYTAATEERDNLIKKGWHDEGIGWTAPSYSSTPVYRLYNPNAGDHHYTTDSYERDYLIKVGWKDEGIGWYSDDAKTVPLYRQYNPNAKAGAHNFTTAKDENDFLVSKGWHQEGIGWYGIKAPEKADAKDAATK